MQDKYVGDVGDYGKYALLNALVDTSFCLGVVWYLNVGVEANEHGKFTEYSDLKDCDPNLFRKLKYLVGENRRLTSEIECSDILPPGVAFYRQPVPAPPKPCLSQLRRDAQKKNREDWFFDAKAKVAHAEVVFLDPDNGIAGSKCLKHHRRSVKYVFLDEVAALVQRGQSVIIYQHQQRKKLEDQISQQQERLAFSSSVVFALSFRPSRIYYVLPANARHKHILLERAQRFASDAWRSCFRLLPNPGDSLC